MKYIDWDQNKSDTLLRDRGISFHIVATYIKEERILDTIDHPNKEKFPNQRMYILEIESYVYAVPFVEDEEKIFLKTIIPSRKLTKQYLHK